MREANQGGVVDLGAGDLVMDGLGQKFATIFFRAKRNIHAVPFILSNHFLRQCKNLAINQERKSYPEHVLVKGHAMDFQRIPHSSDLGKVDRPLHDRLSGLASEVLAGRTDNGAAEVHVSLIQRLVQNPVNDAESADLVQERIWKACIFKKEVHPAEIEVIGREDERSITLELVADVSELSANRRDGIELEDKPCSVRATKNV